MSEKNVKKEDIKEIVENTIDNNTITIENETTEQQNNRNKKIKKDENKSVDVKEVKEIKVVEKVVEKVEVNNNNTPTIEFNDRLYKRLIMENPNYLIYDKNVLVYDSNSNKNPIVFDKEYYTIFNKKYNYMNMRFKIKK